MYLELCGEIFLIWGQEKFWFTVCNLFLWFPIDIYIETHSYLKTSIHPVWNFIFISYHKVFPIDIIAREFITCQGMISAQK